MPNIETKSGAVEVIRRHGTTEEHSKFTGAEAEITVDTDKDTIVVHDGKRVGGYALAKEDDLLNYRKNDKAIDEEDLSSLLQSKINTTMDKVNETSEELSNKADRLDLNNYRLNGVKISENDLDDAVIAKLNSGGSGTAYEVITEEFQSIRDNAITLSKTPYNGKIDNLTINGVSYNDECYVVSSNTIIWTFNSDYNGFDILPEFKVSVTYKTEIE